MMRYMVRTVAWSPERQDNVQVMRQAIPQLEVVTDYNHDGYTTFFEACRLLDATGGVLMEDDVQLCRRFRERVEQTIDAKGSEYVISFFERPKVLLDTRLVGGSQFFWMQCVYLPPGFPSRCLAHYESFRANRPQQHFGMATDRLIAYALTQEHMKYWRIRPTLVQHLPFESVISKRPNNRQTPFFIDDLEAKNGISPAE